MGAGGVVEPHRGSGHGEWLLHMEEKEQFQNCQRNVCRSWWLLAGSEVWVLKLLGAKTLGCFSNVFISPHPCLEFRTFGGATPRSYRALHVEELEDSFGQGLISRVGNLLWWWHWMEELDLETRHSRNSPEQRHWRGDASASATCQAGKGTAKKLPEVLGNMCV